MKLADIFGGSLLGGVKDLIGAFKLPPEKKLELEQIFEENRQIVRLQELKLQEKIQDQIAIEVQTASANIQAEAKSEDKWTSRARPSFMYVMYMLILGVIPFSMFYAWKPERAMLVSEGMKHYLEALPEELWWLFAAGYLGYTGARSVQDWSRNRRGRQP